MLSAQAIEIVQATAPAVAAHATAITEAFYARLFEAVPATRGFFNETHQREGTQARALADAVVAYATHVEDPAVLLPALQGVFHKHCAYGVAPEHYPIVGENLLGAVKQVLGDAATDEVLAAWGEAYGALAEVFVAAEADLYAARASSPGGWSGLRPFRVSRKVPEAQGVTSFYLTPGDGGALPSFFPGQYVAVQVDGGEAAPRTYSLSDRPGQPHLRITLQRQGPPPSAPDQPPGRASSWLHDAVREGDTLQLSAPYGTFGPRPDAPLGRRVVMLAGGLGITPMMSILEQLALERDQVVEVIHSVKDSASQPFRQRIQQLVEAMPGSSFRSIYSRPGPGDAERAAATGWLGLVRLGEMLEDRAADFLVCGPPAYMESMRRALKHLEVPDARVQHHFFGPPRPAEG